MCNCASTFNVRLIKPDEAHMFKGLVNRWGHPTYVGPNMVERHARNGGAILAMHKGSPAAAALVNPRTNVGLVLNVHPQHRGHGLGRAVVAYICPNFWRVVEHAVPFFEREGYTKLGHGHQGRKLITYIMAHKRVMNLAGRVAETLGDQCVCHLSTNEKSTAIHRDEETTS